MIRSVRSRQRRPNGGAVTTLANLARARAIGADGRVRARPADGTVVTLAGSVAHMETTDDAFGSSGIHATARLTVDVRPDLLMMVTMKTKTPEREAGARISRAYEQLLQLIVYGRLPPGARIAEGTLAETLGVSRTPVREALQRLRQEGLLVEVGGGSGLRGRLAVAPLQRERMEEVYALAGAIEGLAVRGLTRIDAAQREQIARELEKIERAFHAEARRRTPEYDRLFELHAAFHRVLVESVAGPETRAVLRTIKPQVDRYEWFYAPLTGRDFTPTRREHAAIIEAVRHGTAQELERAVRANYSNGGQRVGPLIDRFDGRLPAGIPVFSISRNLVGEVR